MKGKVLSGSTQDSQRSIALEFLLSKTSISLSIKFIIISASQTKSQILSLALFELIILQQRSVFKQNYTIWNLTKV